MFTKIKNMFIILFEKVYKNIFNRCNMFTKEKRNEIINFIINNVSKHSSDIVTFVSEQYKISRQAVINYIRRLVQNNIIEVEGTKNNVKYSLKEYSQNFTLLRETHPAEDVVFSDKIKPLLPQDIPENILKICQYGFTEIFNNAVDHSEAKEIICSVSYNAIEIKMLISDDGVGIFNKIQKAFNLEHPRFAILELAKGKLTTAPQKHSGEGIFFTSRLFDRFSILSGNLAFTHIDEDFLFENEAKEIAGTGVWMQIKRDCKRLIKDIFDNYSADKEDYAFSKTIVPVKLMQYEGEALISRSQAKRLISRFEKFKEVMLNFDGVKEIGQAFADEVFRVFVNEHPQVHLMVINTNPEIDRMIKHVKNSIQ